MPNQLENELEVLKKEYIQEISSDIEIIEDLLMDIDKDKNSESLLQLYRKIHSIKGEAGSYGFTVISTICHNFEDIIRTMNTQHVGEHIDLLLDYKDLLFKSIRAYSKNDLKEIEKIEKQFLTSSPIAPEKALKVLLVENSIATSHLITKTLENEGLMVSSAYDGYEALGRLLREKFDLLITSKMVPTLDGMSIINFIKLRKNQLAKAQRDTNETDLKTVLISSNIKEVSEYTFQPDYLILKDSMMTQSILNIIGFIKKQAKPLQKNFHQFHKILLIDDSEDIHALVKLSIKKEPKTQVLSAFNEKEAMKILNELTPNLILLDVHLNKENGTDVLKKIKAQAPWKNIPIIFLTGYANEEEKKSLLGLGALDVIKKPFNVNQLFDQLSSIKI